MASAQVQKPHHGRHRSMSDPFTDPTPHRAQVPRSAPAPPPKNAPPRPPKPSRDAYPDNAATGRAGDPPRTKMHRSQTSVPTLQDVRPSAVANRSISQDSVVRAANSLEKNKQAGRRSGKKGSSHADVIDRLDFSGVGPMFHHDGPFDACAPSRNKHRTKAPMLAWASGANADDAALANAYAPATGSNNYSPYPSARAGDIFVSPRVPYEAGQKKSRDALAEAWGIHEPEPYEEFFAGGGNGQSRPPSAYRGEAPAPSSSRREREPVSQPRLSAEDGARGRREGKRSAIPPPQPIFVPEPEAETYYDNTTGSNPPSPLGSPGNPNAPKRSKSLMQKIRKMRDAPNIPPSDDALEYGALYDGQPGSAPAVPSRPGHRSQRSFLGRIGTAPIGNGVGGAGGVGGGGERRYVAPARPADFSPGSERSTDAYVYIDDPKEKALPAAPADATRPSGESDYFSEEGRYGGGATGLGRKTSLMKKAKGLMRGGK